MKTVVVLLLALLPLFAFGQAYRLKDGEMSLSLEPDKSDHGKPTLSFNIMSYRVMEDSIFKCMVGAKGDTTCEYLDRTKKEKMYIGAMIPVWNNYPRYIAV